MVPWPVWQWSPIKRSAHNPQSLFLSVLKLISVFFISVSSGCQHCCCCCHISKSSRWDTQGSLLYNNFTFLFQNPIMSQLLNYLMCYINPTVIFRVLCCSVTMPIKDILQWHIMLMKKKILPSSNLIIFKRLSIKLKWSALILKIFTDVFYPLFETSLLFPSV